MPGGGQVVARWRRDVQAAGGLREAQTVDSLVHVVRVRHGREPYPGHLRDAQRVRRTHEKSLSVPDVQRSGADRRARSSKQVGRGEQLHGLAAEIAAAGQDAAVRLQNRGGVVAAIDRVAGHRAPEIRRRIPDLGGINGVGGIGVRGLGSTAAPRHEHRAVRQKREVVVLAGVSHGRGRKPGGNRGIQIDCLRRIRGGHGGSRPVERTPYSAGDQDLAVVVHRRRAPVACPVGVVAHHGPGAASGSVQVAGRLARPRVEDLAVGRQEHVGVVRKQKLRAGQVPPRAAGRLPHLRQGIHADGQIRHSRDDQHVAVGQRRHGRVPAAGVHVRKTGPGVGGAVIGGGGGKADVVRDVPARGEQPPVRQEREARAEDVEAGRRRGADSPRGGMTELRPIAVGVRIPEHDLPRREHVGVYRPVGPGVERGPLTDDGGLRTDRRAKADSAPQGQERQGACPSPQGMVCRPSANLPEGDCSLSLQAGVQSIVAMIVRWLVRLPARWYASGGPMRYRPLAPESL